MPHDHAHHMMLHGSDPWTAVTVAGAFVLGLVGSAGHCSLMCGGFVVALARARPAVGWRAAREQASFHAGRLLTYFLLSLLLSAFGVALDAAGMLQARRLWSLLLAAALVGFAVELLWPGRFPLGRWWTRWGRAIGGAFKRLWRGGTRDVFFSGLAWGFIPCMMSGAAIVAAATQPPLRAALVIAAFGVGTALPLLGLAALGRVLPAERRWARVVVAAALTVYGGRLLWLAGN